MGIAIIPVYIIMGVLFGAVHLAVYLIIEALKWSLFVFVEEIWKASFLRWAKVYRTDVGSTRAHSLSGAALALGYSTAQALVYMSLVTLALEGNGGDEEDDVSYTGKPGEITGSELFSMFLISFFFACATMPLNILSAYIVSMELSTVNNDDGKCCPCGFPPGGSAGIRQFLWMLRWPTLLRSLFVVQFWFWVALMIFVDAPGWLFFIGITVCALAIYYGAYKILQSYPSSDTLNSVYRSVYGFELLGAEEDSDFGGDALQMEAGTAIQVAPVVGFAPPPPAPQWGAPEAPPEYQVHRGNAET